jgi:hypothetical protein
LADHDLPAGTARDLRHRLTDPARADDSETLDIAGSITVPSQTRTRTGS